MFFLHRRISTVGSVSPAPTLHPAAIQNEKQNKHVMDTNVQFLLLGREYRIRLGLCIWLKMKKSSATIRDAYTAIQVFEACRVLVSYRLPSMYFYRWPLVFLLLLVPLIYFSLPKRQAIQVGSPGIMLPEVVRGTEKSVLTSQLYPHELACTAPG